MTRNCTHKSPLSFPGWDLFRHGIVGQHVVDQPRRLFSSSQLFSHSWNYVHRSFILYIKGCNLNVRQRISWWAQIVSRKALVMIFWSDFHPISRNHASRTSFSLVPTTQKGQPCWIVTKWTLRRWKWVETTTNWCRSWSAAVEFRVTPKKIFAPKHKKIEIANWHVFAKRQ